MVIMVPYVTETLQEGQGAGVDTLQAFTIPTHRHPLLPQGQGAEAQGAYSHGEGAQVFIEHKCSQLVDIDHL